MRIRYGFEILIICISCATLHFLKISAHSRKSVHGVVIFTNMSLLFLSIEKNPVKLNSQGHVQSKEIRQKFKTEKNIFFMFNA